MNVPAISFKDDDGKVFPDWENKTIGSVLSIGSGKDYKHLSKGDIPVYGTGGYMLSVDKYLYDGESVCIGRKGTIDRPTLLNGKFWTVDTLFYTHSFKNCLPKFIYATFQRIDWKNYNEASGVPSLSKSTIEKVEISLPSIDEQTKIANFLTAVDEKISHLTQKHDLLTQYKNGVMQQIFSQELRFKNDDGGDFPEWEENKLGEVSSFFSGGTPLTTNKGFYTGDIPFIKSGEIGANRTAQFISESGLKGSSAKMVLKGDLLYALYGATSGEVAISQVEGAINQAVLCIRSKLNTYFLLSYFLYKKESILQTYLQGGQGNLSAEIIKSLMVPIPSEQEQTKVANFLTAIDDKITATQTQLQAVKQYKQGLLQQMFV
ncbi:type I restriction modification DNA specificity domain protein [mine drainage metagenome]|uniref:Type I restriction modification DNA specificity domain protein n=1 Tax=mine drainage metagenome TaxID=410659 RepID=A0A1J5TFM5_9ZZZZ